MLSLDFVADAGGSNYACVSVDEHSQTHHPDCRAAALPQAQMEGQPRACSTMHACMHALNGMDQPSSEPSVDRLVCDLNGGK